MTSTAPKSSQQMLVRWDLFQVSCLGVEPSVEGEAGRFVLTSRATDGSVVRFQLQAASAQVATAWGDAVGHILETQRNFLNGKGSKTFHPSQPTLSKTVQGGLLSTTLRDL